MLNEIAGKLRELADVIETAKPDVKKSKQVKSFEEVQAILAKKSLISKSGEVLDVIRTFGAKKLSDVDPSDYEKLLEKVDSL